MTPVLRLLAIEDSEADFLLVERNLRQHGVTAEYLRVDSYAALDKALEAGGWDAVLSDYNLPGMEFRETLRRVLERRPDLPVILVSGSIGEEQAMDLLHSGLSDFVLKDRPLRLAEALRHALETCRITKAQRVAELALQESESRFATMFRSNPLGIGVSRLADGKLVEVNDALLDIFKLPREEVLGRTALEAGFFLNVEDRDRMFEVVRRDQRVSNFQFQCRRRDGEVRDLLMSAERIQLGGEDFLLGMASDITPLRHAEHSLQASEGRYRSLFENMSEGFAHCRVIQEEGQAPDWVYLAVNQSYERMTGLKDVAGRRASEVLPGLLPGNPELYERLGGVARTGHPDKFEVFLQALNVWFSVSAYRPAEGEFVAMLDNISQRKEAEAALRASETRFQSIFRTSPVGIVLSRFANGEILDANAAFLDLIGLPLDRILGQTSFGLGLWVDPGIREKALRNIQDVGRVRALDADLRTASGGLVSVTWSTEVATLDGERVLVNLVQDVTERRRADEERRRLESEVAHSQKLESLGALAGGISHDMNNVLAAIMALGSTLKEIHQADPGLSKAMDTLLHAAGRGKDLVKGLTDFARKDLPEPRPMDLNAAVRKEAALLSRTTLQRVAVDLELAEGLPEVIGDANSISNALMNLCINALDAMPSGGRIGLGTRLGAGGQVELSVRDTGQGMSSEVLQRAMEPFYTTKPTGKGTGLGLALVYGVMKAHGGRVVLRSEPGRGTEVILCFPPAPAAPELVSSGPAEGRNGRCLHILLVDDDDLIRATVPELLEALGHGVTALAGGLEALQRLQSGPSPDLVILDLSMPGMDGEETLERLRLLSPRLPVLLATGHRDERSNRILERFPGVGLIMKPFSFQDLRTKLAEMD